MSAVSTLFLPNIISSLNHASLKVLFFLQRRGREGSDNIEIKMLEILAVVGVRRRWRG